MSRRNRKPPPTAPVRATIESLAHDGRGVAHVNGKATFIDGALPGEEVLFTYLMQRKRFDEGAVTEVITAAAERVTPQCQHFGLCGGCSLQHLRADAQIHMKEQILLDSLRHLGKVTPEQILPPLAGPHWGYRRRARLGVKFVEKKQTLMVGFREKRSAYLADLSRCEVLHPKVGQHLLELRALLQGLAAFNRISQVEVAAGDQAVALVFRHLDPLSAADIDALRAFGQQHDGGGDRRPAGPESGGPRGPGGARRTGRLAEFDVELE